MGCVVSQTGKIQAEAADIESGDGLQRSDIVGLKAGVLREDEVDLKQGDALAWGKDNTWSENRNPGARDAEGVEGNQVSDVVCPSSASTPDHPGKKKLCTYRMDSANELEYRFSNGSGDNTILEIDSRDGLDFLDDSCQPLRSAVSFDERDDGHVSRIQSASFSGRPSTPLSGSKSANNSPYPPSSPFAHLRVKTCSAGLQHSMNYSGSSHQLRSHSHSATVRNQDERGNRKNRCRSSEGGKQERISMKLDYGALEVDDWNRADTGNPPVVFSSNLVGRSSTFYVRASQVQDRKSAFFNFMLQEEALKPPVSGSFLDLDKVARDVIRQDVSEVEIRKLEESLTRQVSSDDALGVALPMPPMFFDKKYELTRVILGIGGHSHVCKGRVRGSGKFIAIKILDCRDETQLQWARDELDVWRQLRHPYIVRLQEYVLNKPVSYFSMELLEGGSLVTYLKHESISPHQMLEDDIRGCMFRIMMAVYHMHTRSIVHMDIKLDNLILSDKNNIQSVKLADFGSAIYANREIPHKCHGTPQYMAPEVIRHNMSVEVAADSSELFKGRLSKASPCCNYWQVSTAADMWSLGVVMFTLLGKYM
eukprot:CAMPEP_0197866348 /NCGR_PEP_ID=MMETSP1438-20131217/44167_1 /TAXON_ID=1461541 /ORGANISM="Pterosperma sp., Strain CCMP1384" /LENGTH=592 /DNA_ID=CAMNT_0043484909 /DNA_START=654 /DNA_END=2429 /DNA_ORIENTATION=-